MYTTAERVTERFTALTGEPTHVTCTSFVEVVQMYLSLLGKQKFSSDERLKKYTAGIRKLEETSTAVENMKSDLVAAQPMLETSKQNAKLVAISLSEDKQRAALMEDALLEERGAADKARQEAQLIRDDCQRDLDEVLPGLHQALRSLESLDKRDLQELKSFPSPPALVETVMNAVCLLLGRKQSWEEAKKVLNDTSLLSTLQDYDKDNLPPKLMHQLSKYTALEDFVPEKVANVSKAATSLCMWVRAVESYAKVLKVIEPKQKRFLEAEDVLRKAEENLSKKQRILEEVQARIKSLTEQHAACQQKVTDLEAQIRITEQRLARAGSVLSGVSVEGSRWKLDAEAMEGDKRTLLSDALLSAAGMLVYAGPLTREFRDMMIHQWLSICLDEGLPVRDNFDLARILSTPLETRQWTLEGLPNDVASIENAILVSNCAKWPLLIDPQEQGTRWFRNRQSRREFREFSWSEDNALQTFSDAAIAGMTVLINLSESSANSTMDALIAAVKVRPGSRAMARIGDRSVPWNPHFRMVLATKLAASEIALELQGELSIVSFRITPLTLEEQLLSQIILHETPWLEEQRSRLVLSIAKDMELKSNIQEKILVLLANADGDILADDRFLEVLEDSRSTYETIEKRMSEASAAADELEQTRQLYMSLACRGSLLYLALCDLSALDHLYQWSLEVFTNQLQATLSNCQDTTESRRDSLIDLLTWEVFCKTCRGLFDSHRLVFAFTIAKAIDSQAGNVPQAALEFLLRGIKQQEADAFDSARPPWISEATWKNILYLDTKVGGQFQGLAIAASQEDGAWKALIESGEELAGRLPQINGKDLGAFESFVVIKALRGSELHAGCRVYVQSVLGPRYISSPQQDFSKALEDSTALTPLILILSPESDPVGPIRALAAHAALPDEKLHLLSLGQGQRKIAQEVLQYARVNGDWVCLQNCHLAESFMPVLQQLHDTLRKQQVHQDFRLFLTCQPTKILPVGLVKQSIKITTESPSGIRESVMRCLTDLDSCGSEDVVDCPAYKRWLFSLALFHSLVLDRKRFGSVGWNKSYDWAVADFLVSQRSLYEAAKCGSSELPIEQLVWLTAELHYGGRVTDTMDQRLLISLFKRSFSAMKLGSGDQDTALRPYVLPADYGYKDIKEFAMSLPVDASPEILGLDSGAAVVSGEILSSKLFDCLLATHRATHALARENREETLTSLIADILAKLPDNEPFDIAAKPDSDPAVGKQTKLHDLSPYTQFLNGEAQAFSALLAYIRETLTQLQGAVRGWSVMTEKLDELSNALYFQLVPKAWTAASYPSQLSLGTWLEDLGRRVNSVQRWLLCGPPPVFNIATFFKPQNFFAATLRVFARIKHESLESVSFRTKVTAIENVADIDTPPSEGILIAGLSLQGATWSLEENILKESDRQLLFYCMPPIHLTPSLQSTVEKQTYRCPIYRTCGRTSECDVVGFLDLPTGSQTFAECTFAHQFSLVSIELPYSGGTVVCLRVEHGR
ncbi:hypothetical protein Esti_003650 [Eimeria stiedai]